MQICAQSALEQKWAFPSGRTSLEAIVAGQSPRHTLRLFCKFILLGCYPKGVKLRLWECGKLHVCKASQGCSRTSLLGHCLFPQTTCIAIQLGHSLWNEIQRFPGMLQGWNCARAGNHWKKQPNKGYKNSLY